MKRLAVWLLLGSVALWGQQTCAQDLPEEERPLVRCRRPVCTHECPVGYQTDTTGCPVCQCLKDPCEGDDKCPESCLPKPCSQHPCTSLAFECTPELPMPCAMPMCANQCPNGYALDKRGCMTCRCKPQSCEDKKCRDGERCRMHMPPCKDADCEMIAICIKDDGHFPQSNPQCPPFMCEFEIACEFGNKKDKDGCSTCDCNTDTCDEHVCEEGTVCEARLELCDGLDCPIVPVCKARPLCLEAQDMWDMMRNSGPEMGHGMMGGMHGGGDMPMMGRPPRRGHMMPRPVCDRVTGHFTPMQCDMGLLGRCWCVDDRGLEIPGTKADSSATVNCAHNHTVSLDLQMQMHHEMDNIEEHFEDLESAMREHMSQWMMMDEEWITVAEITLVTPNEEEVEVLQIHVVVIHDGETDLPSAANFLRRQLQQGRCQVPFQGQVLSPRPDSVQIHHKFEVIQAPELPEQPLIDGDEELVDPPTEPVTCWVGARRFYRHHRMPVIIGCVGAIIFLTVLISLTITAIKRRRMASHQFSHRRLENMDNFRKNLVLSNEMDLSVDPVTGEKKKLPLGDPSVVVPGPQEEKVSLA